MNAPALPNADRLGRALTALRSIAQAAALAMRQGDEARLRESGAAILAEWNDSNDPPDISTGMDGWHGVIKSQGYRIALTDAADDGGAALGLYHGGTLDDPLGDPIALDTIRD